MMKNKLLLWNSKNHGLTVVLQSIQSLFEKYKIELDEILLLQSSDFDAVQIAELDLYRNPDRTRFSKYRSKFEERENKRIEAVYKQVLDLKEQKRKTRITQKRLHLKSVTDYQSIYNEIREYLKTLPNNIQLHINVSPGTPQMHTVWLMLNASGYLPSSVKIWSSQFDREKKRYLFDEIKFKPKTYLNDTFESSYRKKYAIKINPNDTKSSKRREAEEQLQLFASIPEVPILLIGERGVGKTTYVEQLIKREPHYQDKPYQVLPCGIFSEDLMRSELFGYAKGAFTGANQDKKGIFHQFKDGGILFLDEIHDLSTSLQRQLMQVLQSGEFLPIGSHQSEQTTFRLITATNVSFEELSQKLSLDFLDRIAQYIIEIPPLRMCREDIPQYWEKTWNNIANDELLPSSKVLHQLFDNYPFSGNFRDLQRLANYIFAFLKQHDSQKATTLAIIAIKKWQSKNLKQQPETYLQSGKTYNEIVNQFNQNVANWAITEYRSRKKACEILDKSEAWLSNALHGKSRKV